MVRSLAEWYGYSRELAYELVDLPRSSYYYRSHKADESQLVADLKAVAGEHVTYGTRRARSQLRRPPYGYQINRKRVQRIMCQTGLLRPARRRKSRTTDSNHPYPRYSNLSRFGYAISFISDWDKALST